jgi:hypothetical protein
VGETATLARLNAIYLLKEQDENDDDIPLPPHLVNVSNVQECIESLDAYFETKRGDFGCPLSYVTD